MNRFIHLSLLLALALLTEHATAQVNLDSGLLAYYPFNTNALDESGNGHDGTINGATLTEDRFGTANAAFMFDGINDHIVLDQHQATLTNVTVCAWVNISRLNNKSDDYAQIFRQPYLAVNRSTKKAAVYAYGVNDVASDSYYQSNNQVPLEEWVFLVSTYEQLTGQYKIYINGVADVIVSNKFGNPTLRINQIGGEPGQAQGRYFAGAIDDIRVYDRVITEDEIAALNTRPNPTSIDLLPSDLISVYPNPSHGNIKVESPRHPLQSVSLLDITGRKIPAEIHLFDHEAQVQTNYQGVAILRIDSPDGQWIKRVILN